VLDFFGKSSIWIGYVLIAAAVVFVIVGIVGGKGIAIVVGLILAVAGILRIMFGRRLRDRAGAPG
jgi:uncharacterized membrane protein HdeD (DUF308 family)